ncbi:hypothetical protein J2X57_002121 [Luteibacter sp. 1214]|uniref:XVIPCD domain-containing protein n=1 Tax=Luteibacter sp. 1214 TaxID=2817735 RepID=UPI002865E269|nr:XVIPCD domain-containing protein [Luteibacter sp. 1214]MDR6642909.1 hypothetical protein [Luteibacter sp. 1214]
MEKPNTQLEAAFATFALQHGADRATQLRAALTSNQTMLHELNASTANGTVRAFDLEAAGSSPYTVGHFEAASGTIKLPPSIFSASGPAPTGDLIAVGRVQTMIASFASGTYVDVAGRSHKVAGTMVDNLQATLNESPVLAYEVKRAVTVADPANATHLALEKFAILDPKVGAGGTYDGAQHVMNLPATSLIKKTPATPNGEFDINDLTFVVGHEIQHAFNNGDAVNARNGLQADAWKIATSGSGNHDYTVPFAQYIQSGRIDEAKAEIGGWNALLSRQQHIHPGANLADMASASGRTMDFIERSAGLGQSYVPKSGLTINPDLSINPTPANVAAMGKHYFDRPPLNHVPAGNHDRPMTLGARRDADYPNYYGTNAVATMVWAEDGAKSLHAVAPTVSINMSSLGLREELLEHVGVNLGKTSHAPRPYIDTSQPSGTVHHFDHTADGSQKNQYIPVQEAPPRIPQRLDDPTHPDNAFFKQVQGHVAALDRSIGRTPDEHTDQIASALTVQARADGLKRVDQVAISTTGDAMWAVQMPPGRNDHLFDLQTKVPTAEANTPMEQSAAKWPEAMQQFQGHEQAQQQSQQRAMDRQQADTQAQGAAGPSMAR